jgi:Domain of unknown function (DUF427)
MNKSPGHQQQPQHHVTSRRLAQRMSVTVAGEVIAQSSNVLRVDEDGHPARFYFPRPPAPSRGRRATSMSWRRVTCYEAPYGATKTPTKSIATSKAASPLMTTRFPNSISAALQCKRKSTNRATPLLLACRRFPQLYLVALRVHDPAKFAELRFLGFLQDVTSFSAECGQESMKIGHPIIDHERCSAWGEILTVSDGPSGFPRNWMA